MERCIHCGSELAVDRATCPSCQARALGGRAEAKVEIFPGETPTLPALCCCCLGPSEEAISTEVHVGPRRSVSVSVPWCHTCKQRSSITVLFLLAGMLGLSTLGVAGILLLDPHAYGMMALALFVGLMGGAALGLELAKIMNRRGHVSRCNAVSSRRADAFSRDGRSGGKLAFGNRAFAREWLRLNPRR